MHYTAPPSTRGVRPTSPTPSTGDGRKKPPAAQDGGFESYAERIDANKIRQRSESFSDHFSQARLFFHSMSPHEQEHIIAAYSFELGKVEREFIRARQVNEILANIDLELAKRVAQNLGLAAPKAGTVDVPKTSLGPLAGPEPGQPAARRHQNPKGSDPGGQWRGWGSD